MFEFRGNIPASKSWLNRALIIQHFCPEIKVEVQSESEDVLNLNTALRSIGKSSEFSLGMGGTSFRFFAFLISRQSGSWDLQAHPRLLERPQQEILSILNQLGVKCEFRQNILQIHSQGWRYPEKIICSADISSQFVSGLLLSSWGLDFDLKIEIKKPIISYGYLKMTVELLRQTGMELQESENDNSLNYLIPKKQKAYNSILEPEIDISSAFALLSAAVINGKALIANWNSRSTQPDLAFINIFQKMNIKYSIKDRNFLAEKQTCWNSLEYNLNNSPDLFPVLAVLCAFADGVSVLYGASQLKFKESDRISKTKELLDLIKVKSEILPDGLRIFGQSASRDLQEKFSFNPDHDHRMAMAAAMLKLKGYNIEISQPQVVNKSYSSFWKDIGLAQ